MAIVCVDSNIMVWGIKETASPSQMDMIPRAKDFLKWLDDNDKQIMIPTPVVTELLMPIPLEDHYSFLQKLRDRFLIFPFDELAAIKCAEIWQAKAKDEVLKEYRETHHVNKQQIKFDYQIAAIAVTRGVECIYSHDPHLRKFVGDIIPVREMSIPIPPPLPLYQISLFQGLQ